MRTRSFDALLVHTLFTLSLLLALSSPTFAQQVSGDDEESGEEILAREQFYQTRRAGGPGKQIPEDGFAKAAAEVSSARAKAAGRTTFGAAPPSWVSVNPSGMVYAVTGANHIAGRTNVIAFDPLDPNVFYCGAAGGGVWKTYDGGATWTPLTDHLSSLTCGALTVDPNDFLTVYFGTGEQNYSLDSYYGDGIYKSTDGGDTWARVATTSVGRYFSTLVVDPGNSNIVYAAGSNGVYKSTNGGANWSTTSSGTSVNSLVIDPSNSQILYCSRGGPGTNVIRKSTDAGGTWTTLTNGLPTSLAARTQLAISPSDPLTLYASIARTTNSSLLGLYRTTDGGSSWTLRNNSVNYLGSQGWYDNSVTVHPSNPDVIVVGGLDVYTSFDGGANLNQVTRWFTNFSLEMSHADIHFLGFNGPTLYCGSDGGVYKSTDEGGSWTDLNATLSTLQYQSADYDPTNPQKLYGGCQDNNLQTSTDGGATWIQRETGDGGYSLVDPVVPEIVYGQYVGGSIKISGNSGVSFLEIRPADGTGGLFYNPFELAPSDHNTVVYAQSDIWKTTDVLNTTSHTGWTKLSGPVGGSVSAIGISHQTAAKMYFGTDNGQILVTTDDGATWSTTAGYPYVSDLAVDPTNDAVCYATFGGFGAAAHVYKTTTSGASWFSVTGNLPNIPTNSIVIRSVAPRMLFVGTDLGVFRSVNDGASWESFNNGLPAATVYDLKYKEGNQLLLAATHGRGCFTCDVSGYAFDAAPRTIAFGSLLIGGTKQDSIVVTNLGASPMTISSVTSSRSEFVVAPTSASIPAGGTRTFTVTFTPTPSGKITASIVFANSSISSPDSVVLTAYGGVGTVHVVKMVDADGNLGTTGDRTPKSWGLAVYDNTVSPGTLIAQENTNHLLTLVPHVGTYIIAETDSGVPWIRLNGNKAFFDTIAVAPLEVKADTIINAKYLVTTSISSGWNMISNPFVIADASVATLYPTATAGAYAYLPGVGYSLATELASGYGYFLKFPGSLVQTYQGNPFNSTEITVAPGWNLIGSLHRKVPVNTIVHVPPNNTSSVYYDYAGGYHRSDTIVPGRGYWIKIKQLGTLTLETSGSAIPSVSLPRRDAIAEASSLTFTDLSGGTQTLYFGTADRETEPELYEMPPAVADGTFDARFASNRIAEFLPTDRPAPEPRILLSSAAYPVSVEWTLRGETGLDLRDELGGTLFSAPLTGRRGRALLTDERVRTLVLASTPPALPAVFSLEQNYPNPFNPSTTVRYQLPAESRVILRVYNALGQEVTTLVDAQEPGGYRSVEWNGVDRSGNAVASGVYVLRLDAVRTDNPATRFTQARKMAVVR